MRRLTTAQVDGAPQHRPLLLMCHDYPPLTGGGLAATVHDIAGLMNNSYEVAIVSSRVVDHFADDRGTVGPHGPIRTLASTWRLLLRADCVVTHWTFSFRWLSSFALVAGPILRRPTICVLHTGPLHCRYNRLRTLPAPARRQLLRLAAMAARQCAAVVALSPSHSESVQGAGIRVTHTMPGPVGEHFRYADSYCRHLRSTDLDVVGFAGEFSDLKGAEALPMLVSMAAPEFGFRIAGRGPLGSMLRCSIAGLPEASRLRVLISDRLEPEEMPSFFTHVDAVLICSRSESQSRLAIEAMLAGVVVLARRVDGLCDLVQDGRTGFFVDPDDAEDVIRCLRRLRTHPEQLSAVRLRAHDVAQELVDEAARSWPRLVAEVAQVATRLI